MLPDGTGFIGAGGWRFRLRSYSTLRCGDTSIMWLFPHRRRRRQRIINCVGIYPTFIRDGSARGSYSFMGGIRMHRISPLKYRRVTGDAPWTRTMQMILRMRRGLHIRYMSCSCSLPPFGFASRRYKRCRSGLFPHYRPHPYGSGCVLLDIRVHYSSGAFRQYCFSEAIPL